MRKEIWRRKVLFGLSFIGLLAIGCRNPGAATKDCPVLTAGDTAIHQLVHAPAAKNTRCGDQRLQAMDDYQQGQSKFYVFGLVPPGGALVKDLKARYRVTLVTRGCQPDPALICYNAAIDSLFSARSGISISKIIGEGQR